MAKRGRRSTWGSKRKRSENTWELRYTVAGKAKTETFHGTAKEADRRLSDLRIKYEGAQPDMTLDQFWRVDYLPMAEANLAPSTIEGYIQKYDHDIRPVFGDRPLRKITPRDIQDWLSKMTKEKAKHCRTVLSSIMAYAFVRENIDDNPVRRKYIMPKEEARPLTKDTYSIEELDEIFHACRGQVWEAAFIIAAFGGAQRDEAMSPKVDEIKFIDDFAVFEVVRGVQRINGEVRIVEDTKNKYRNEDVIVLPPYAARLKELVEEARERGDTWVTDDGFGNPNCPARISQAYKRWFCRQPYKYIPFRNLRDSYATVTHAMGVDGMMVSKLMRHAKPDTTYIHYDRPKRADKINTLKRAMGSYGQTEKSG